MVSGMHFIKYGFGPPPSPTPSNHAINAYTRSTTSSNASVDAQASCELVDTDDVDGYSEFEFESDDDFADAPPNGYQPHGAAIWKAIGAGYDLPWTSDTSRWDHFHFVRARRPLTPELFEPRPSHEVALQDALERFELVCLSFDEREESS